MNSVLNFIRAVTITTSRKDRKLHDERLKKLDPVAYYFWTTGGFI